jgi:hypothetical protein
LNTIYLLEVIEGLGITIRPVKTIVQANENLLGKIIEDKFCYGYTEEQCLNTFKDYCAKKIEENNKRHMEENEKYFNFQAQISDLTWKVRETKYQNESEEVRA